MKYLRSIPSSMDANIVGSIDQRLKNVERQYNVRILHAIESGSRAWGFPSPDSDYDCRFIYVRPIEDYLQLYAERDVIETPLDKIYDVNGWDLIKALRLLHSGNAVVLEWLQSPIIYQSVEPFRTELLELAIATFNYKKVFYHYLNLARKQMALWLHDEVKLKKIFYMLRPTFALQWLMEGHLGIVPMEFSTLLEECLVEKSLLDLIHELMAQKAITRELGSGKIAEPILSFLYQTIQRAEDFIQNDENDKLESKESIKDLNNFFYKWIKLNGECN